MEGLPLYIDPAVCLMASLVMLLTLDWLWPRGPASEGTLAKQLCNKLQVETNKLMK